MKNYIVYIYCLFTNVCLGQYFFNADESEEFQKFQSDLSEYSEIHPGERSNILGDFSLSDECDLNNAHLLIKKHGYELIWQYNRSGGVEMCQHYGINAPSPFPICNSATIDSPTTDSLNFDFAQSVQMKTYSLSCTSVGDKYICLGKARPTSSVNSTLYYYIKSE
jgi:hypothetical protein